MEQCHSVTTDVCNEVPKEHYVDVPQEKCGDEPVKQELMTEPLADNADYGKEEDESEALLKKHDALMFNLE